MELKRITKLSTPTRLAIQVFADVEDVQIKIENEDWQSMKNEEVIYFENLKSHSCYHITAKTDTEQITTAFQTSFDVQEKPPHVRKHAGGSRAGGVHNA
ncbi:MAG: hypothetical protein GX660_25865 [Clostridiaceae bacterium]|nr:hypothetical protein [Clostridiaceae bacterium]